MIIRLNNELYRGHTKNNKESENEDSRDIEK